MKASKTLLLICIFLPVILNCSLPGLVPTPEQIAPVEVQSTVVEATASAGPISTALPTATAEPPAIIPSSTSTTKPTPKIVLIGHPSLSLGEAANYIQTQSGFNVQVNTVVPEADMLLFTINAPDGPMQGLLDEINRLQGQTLSRIAILLTHTEEMPDPELQQLVLLEFRELMYKYTIPIQVDQLEVLTTADPDLISKLQALLILPPTKMQIHAPSP